MVVGITFYFVKIFYIEIAFSIHLPHFSANFTTFCSQFTIKCLGSGQKVGLGNLKQTYIVFFFLIFLFFFFFFFLPYTYKIPGHHHAIFNKHPASVKWFIPSMIGNTCSLHKSDIVLLGFSLRSPGTLRVVSFFSCTPNFSNIKRNLNTKDGITRNATQVEFQEDSAFRAIGHHTL